MSDPFVVVGGDAAGLSAASKLRREDPDREVIVFEKGQWVSFAHCGTPYFVKGEVGSLTDLLSLTPEDVAERGIDLRRGREVVAVDPDARVVTVETPEGTREQPYGDLLVATGARAAQGPFGSLDRDGAFTLHGMDSAAAIRAFLTPPAEFAVEDLGGDDYLDAERAARYGAMEPPERVAVVGGGYVGVEMAEALDAWGLDVEVFQRSGTVLPGFGAAIGERVEDHLKAEGVGVHCDTPVDALLGEDRVTGVRVGEDRIPADMALVGVGVRPNTGFLAGTGIDRDDRGTVVVDRYGRTSAPDVYAAGDCATAFHAVTGQRAWVPLGLTANRAGRAVGTTVAGEPTPVGTTAGTAAVKAMALEAGRTGIIDHEAAREAGYDPVSETITAGSRSGYYPGGSETTVTLTADRGTGRLLGGAIVGRDRAAIRIDTVATALEGGLTVAELERSDLAYAPPFSPVWDPVLVAAKVLRGSL